MPTQITIPMRLDLSTMQIGTAIFLSGLMAILIGAARTFRNMAASIAWGLALVLLIMSGLLDLGLELFWLSVAMTVMLLIVGFVARWAQ